MRSFKGVLIGSLLILVSHLSIAQRFAVASTGWSSTSTWSASRGGASGASVPTSSDDVYLDGFSVILAGGTNGACNNLYVRDVTNSIRGGAGTNTITISGELAVLDNSDAYVIPVNSVIQSSSSLTFIFIANAQDAVNVDGWSTSASIRKVTFNPGIGNTITLPNFAVAASGVLTVSSGTLNLTGNLQGASSASILVNSGSTLLVSSGSISGNGTNSTKFPSLTVNGTLTSQNNTTSFVNADVIALNSGSVFNVGYNGSNQTEAWWYQSISPSSQTIDPASTFNFNSSTSQNVFAQSYGNLILSGSSTTKTVSGAGSINIKGNLSFSNTNITFTVSSSNQVIFDGTGSQGINGGGTANFNGGLQVNKPTGILLLAQNVTVQNGLTIASGGTIDLGSSTFTLSGNLSNDGTFAPTNSTTINAGTTAISGSSTTSFNNLTISPSGSLSAPNGNVNIAGDFANNGTFTANAGTLVFNGSAAQSITGTISANNITVSNPAGVNNNGTLTLNGILNLTGTGAFNANGAGAGTLTLASNGLSSSGMIGALSIPTNFSGTVTVQRFINGPGDWRYFSMPITNGTVGTWKAAFPTTGSFSDPSPNGVNGVIDQTAASIYYYDAPTQAYVAVGSGISTGSTTLFNTVGYSAYTYLTGNFTINATGSIAKGTVNIPLNTTSPGWNLVPNPYPSAIDWNLMNRTGLSNTMNLRITNGTFATYVAGAGTCTGCGFNTNWRGEVPIGQSFWINSTSATNLGLTEAVKTTTQPTFVREATAENFVRITLNSPTQIDDAVVMFKPGASASFDPAYDGPKRKNGNYISSLGRNSYMNISSYTSDPLADMAINVLPTLACQGAVKLKVSDVPAGNYSLKFTELESMSLGYAILLKDNFLGTQRTVSNSMVYSFDVTADPTSFGDTRFELQFSAPSISTLSSQSFTANSTCSSSNIGFQLSNSQRGINYQFFMGTNSVTPEVLGNDGVISFFVDKSALSIGANSITVKATTPGGCSTMNFPNIITYKYDKVSEVSNVVNATSCGPGSVSLKVSGAPSDGSYRWYGSPNSTTPIVGATQDTFTAKLDSTKWFYVAAVNALGCESVVRAKVIAEVVNLVVPLVTMTGNMLSVQKGLPNQQWYKDGNAISGGTTPTLDVTSSGSYSVTTTDKGCSKSSDNIVMTITAIDDGVEYEIKAYPNPVSSLLFIKIPSTQITSLKSIVMFDGKGSVVTSSDSNSSLLDVGVKTIDMSEQPMGLYLIKFLIGSEVKSIKILKR
ncbi:MAG: T9SS type A sorting domain-containing protein [Cyclobacteriaceae bacterium]